MKCPKAGCKGSFRVTNTFLAGETARTMKLQCDSCGLIGTACQILVNVNPGSGQGAHALAGRMKKNPGTVPGSIKPSQFDSVSED